ncbi:gamma-butyrobetaine dioxygenase-like isoform X2 [Eriocheir sinensis]|uniref:gamma-butyrobetaine dioxygenase-like isoform X2 n=1 Tax=Eriocheir sinensis TaxID=95602 RepID=UPI0021CA0A77|nr:gamma-butyrobetaine dioxygenase-like isoform X2 [Eriocheir sinensis]
MVYCIWLSSVYADTPKKSARSIAFAEKNWKAAKVGVELRKQKTEENAAAGAPHHSRQLPHRNLPLCTLHPHDLQVPRKGSVCLPQKKQHVNSVVGNPTATGGDAPDATLQDTLQQGLLKYGQSFTHNSFGSDSMDVETVPLRSDIELWDRTTIWSNFPELSYTEMMESDSGLRRWLDMFYKYGIAVLRGVPTEKNKITEVVERFAYVRETQYGRTFDVINKTEEGAHLAFTGLALAHHTDLNYRKQTPGIQLLHCLTANDPKLSDGDTGGRSFFADGFRIAQWLEENEPAAFHVLTSTPVRFWVRNEGQQYSAVWPVLCTNSDGDVIELHYNNRVMQPLQASTHVVIPFYHAYKLFSDKLRDPSSNLEFSLVPGDLVAFNNHRVLHGRTAFNPTKVARHLVGCYADMDEALSKYDSLQAKFHTK